MEQGALPLLPGPLYRSGWWHPGPLEYKCRDGEGEPWVLLQERALSPSCGPVTPNPSLLWTVCTCVQTQGHSPAELFTF